MPQVSLAKELDERFPGGSDKIVARPSNPDEAFRRARKGEDCANIPWMNPANRETINGMIKTRLDKGFDLTKEQDRVEYRKRLQATSSNAQAAEEMAAYRSFVITNDVMASPFALAAFQQIDLSPDELPMIERPRSRNFQRFTIRSQGIDGGSRQQQWQTTKSVSQFELDSIASDRLNYPLMDIQQGDINQSEAINVELKYDMEMKIDSLAKTNLDSTSLDTGMRALLSVHPSVNTSNIPDRNHYDLNAVFPGNAGVLTIQKLKHILNHIALLQSVGGPLDGLTIQTIMLSPQNMRDSWDFMDLVSGVGSSIEGPAPDQTVTRETRESIFKNGMFTSAWGYNWSWTPNSQLAKGKMYIFMNQPIGWMFTKQSFDKVFQWNESNSPDHAESNMGEIMMRRVLSFLLVDLWAYRVLIIDL
jgi:hypothetical protein